ncbi:hypothetical protein CAPTEDRAFT_207769 [Capitella teleta]|uniref:Fork-head domain-containing protein n=1 Tax=Capitella teleta TaxID=283909 RepID=R7TWX4_CAPTE|nr:hypothetical protein CAPTEDRAFT_207769 [Capitella teleta]|eukprot:ELT98107.1 hypothetical protein CAPTEDRAFT_207769 [Capitella teleta]
MDNGVSPSSFNQTNLKHSLTQATDRQKDAKTLKSSSGSGICFSIDDLNDPMNSPDEDEKLYVSSNGRVRLRPLDSGKPPCSYIALAYMTITSSPGKKATSRQIIQSIRERFPYFCKSNKWHISVCHVLFINSCFVKIPQENLDEDGNFKC